MAQAQLNAAATKMTTTPQSVYNPKFTPPQSQDGFGVEMGMYDHRPNSVMAREDFSILTTTMDGIISAMNVSSDQISNHTNILMAELKETKEKIQSLEQKMDMQAKSFQQQLEHLYKKNQSSTSLQLKQNVEDMKHTSQKVVDVVENILKELQEEKNKHSKSNYYPSTYKAGPSQPSTYNAGPSQTYKKKGACFICQDPGHYSPDCPNKPENTQPQKPEEQEAANSWKNRKQNSCCYYCGGTGHWVSECPNKNIPEEMEQEFKEEFNPEFDPDLQDFEIPPAKKSKPPAKKAEPKKRAYTFKKKTVPQ